MHPAFGGLEEIFQGFAVIRTGKSELYPEIPAALLDAGGRTPAVAIPAYARVEDAARAFAAGYQRHVIRPSIPLRSRSSWPTSGEGASVEHPSVSALRRKKWQ